MRPPRAYEEVSSHSHLALSKSLKVDNDVIKRELLQYFSIFGRHWIRSILILKFWTMYILINLELAPFLTFTHRAALPFGHIVPLAVQLTALGSEADGNTPLASTEPTVVHSKHISIMIFHIVEHTGWLCFWKELKQTRHIQSHFWVVSFYVFQTASRNILSGSGRLKFDGNLLNLASFFKITEAIKQCKVK